MSLSFQQPLVLLVLPACLAVVAVLWRTSRTYMPPGRRRVSLALRTAVVSLLVLVLAGPLMQLPADRLAVAFLLDRSDSILPGARADEEAWLSRALASKPLEDQAAILTFARDATLERDLSTEATAPRLASDTSDDGGNRTDIAGAIRAGVAALPPDAARRLVLMTDGQANEGDALEAATLAAAAGVQIMTVSTTANTGPEVALSQVDAPAQLREGERSNIAIQIDSTVSTSATLHLLVDGAAVAEQDVSLNVGANRVLVPLTPLQAGHHVVRAQIDPAEDTLPQNNTGGAVITVSGPPTILVVEGGSGDGGYLAQALQTSGMRVELVGPHSGTLTSDQLRSYAAVVLANVPADALAPAEMDALKGYVQTFGGGLVVTGGDQAFGPGSYARTPLEDMLPVRMDLRGKSVSASTALILAIDTSGSMTESINGITILDAAEQAAIAAAASLEPDDLIGVIAYEEPDRWVIPPTPANNLDAIDSLVGQMQAHGSDASIQEVLQMGSDGLQSVNARTKHLVVLTDGEVPPGDYAALDQQMNASGITVSTIGLGRQVDAQLLQTVASLGGGGFYDGNDLATLPQLVVRETQQVQRAAIVEGDFQPLIVSADPAVMGIDTLPDLGGYVATTPKPQASVVVASRELDPLLAEWQYGLGRIVAWTSDVRNRWAAAWLEWPDFARFWTQVIQRSARPPQDPDRQLAITLDADQARITVDAQAGTSPSERHYLNNLPTTASVTGPRGQQQDLKLPQVGPGQYQAALPVEDDGVYTVDVTQTNPDGSESSLAGGFVVPYSPEYRAIGVNRDMLTQIAAEGNGRLLSDPSEAFGHDLPGVTAPRPLWPSLLALVVLLFVADIAVRRLRLGSSELRLAYGVARRRLGLDDATAVRPVTRPQARQQPKIPQRAPAQRVTPVSVPRQPRADISDTSEVPSSASRLLAAKRRAGHR